MTVFYYPVAMGMVALVESTRVMAEFLFLSPLPLSYSQSPSLLSHLVPFSGYKRTFLVVSFEAEIADPRQ